MCSMHIQLRVTYQLEQELHSFLVNETFKRYNWQSEVHTVLGTRDNLFFSDPLFSFKGKGTVCEVLKNKTTVMLT